MKVERLLEYVLHKAGLQTSQDEQTLEEESATVTRHRGVWKCPDSDHEPEEPTLTRFSGTINDKGNYNEELQ